MYSMGIGVILQISRQRSCSQVPLSLFSSGKALQAQQAFSLIVKSIMAVMMLFPPKQQQKGRLL